MSDFLDTNGQPLALGFRVGYLASVNQREVTLHEGQITNIYAKARHNFPLKSPSVGSIDYNQPIVLSLVKMTDDANYTRFKGALVTLRFRRQEATDQGQGVSDGLQQL